MEDEQRIIADALVTYADACTLPLLTPSCPYYRHTAVGATCGEECRGIIARHGGEERPTDSIVVAGLVMRGRVLPARVVGGMVEFDATKAYLLDRDSPPSAQSTASLLLSLRAILLEHAILGEDSRREEASAVWDELSRRITRMDQVFIGGAAHAVAGAVSARVVLDYLARRGDIDLDEIIGTHQESEERSWLLAAEASSASGAKTGRRTSRFAPNLDLLKEFLPQLFESLNDSEGLRADPLIAHVLSPAFANRVVRWLGNLLPLDLPATLAVRPPVGALFAALDSADDPEREGRWLWERFTVTSEENWSLSSLVLEWDWVQRGQTDLCDGRAMAERSSDSERLSRLAMQRSVSSEQGAALRRGFDPTAYVPSALQLLVDGDVAGAARIFEGLVELSPGHATAWNNLGFCQLPIDPARALVSLKRADALSRDPSLLAAANLVLALHLSRDDEEAIDTADAALEEDRPIEAGAAWIWRHPNDDPDVELQLGTVESVRPYLTKLRDHIREGQCGRTVATN